MAGIRVERVYGDGLRQRRRPLIPGGEKEALTLLAEKNHEAQYLVSLRPSLELKNETRVYERRERIVWP